MKAATYLLAAVAMAASPELAVATHSEGPELLPVVWGALVIGALTGGLAGFQQSDPGVGFAWAIGLFLAATIGWIAFFEEDPVLSSLMMPFLIALPGIPLVVAYFIAFGLLSLFRERIKQSRARSASAKNEP